MIADNQTPEQRINQLEDALNTKYCTSWRAKGIIEALSDELTTFGDCVYRFNDESTHENATMLALAGVLHDTAQSNLDTINKAQL